MYEDIALCVRRRRVVRRDEVSRLRKVEAAAIEAYRAYSAIFRGSCWNERDRAAFAALYFALRDRL